MDNRRWTIIIKLFVLSSIIYFLFSIFHCLLSIVYCLSPNIINVTPCAIIFDFIFSDKVTELFKKNQKICYLTAYEKIFKKNINIFKPFAILQFFY